VKTTFASKHFASKHFASGHWAGEGVTSFVVATVWSVDLRMTVNATITLRHTNTGDIELKHTPLASDELLM